MTVLDTRDTSHGVVLTGSRVGSRQRYMVSSSLRDWMAVSFIGRLSGYDGHPLAALLLADGRTTLAPQPIGGSIASAARFASHTGLHGGRVVVLGA